jgi:hypothetical protein
MKSFIKPYISQNINIRKSFPLIKASHQTYDIAVTVTYGIFRLLEYENYPIAMERTDVEIIGTILALIWDINWRFNPNIFILIGGIGGISYISEKFMTTDKITASLLHSFVHLCGYIAYVLLIFDIISFFFQ